MVKSTVTSIIGNENHRVRLFPVIVFENLSGGSSVAEPRGKTLVNVLLTLDRRVIGIVGIALVQVQPA